MFTNNFFCYVYGIISKTYKTSLIADMGQGSWVATASRFPIMESKVMTDTGIISQGSKRTANAKRQTKTRNNKLTAFLTGCQEMLRVTE